MTTHHSSPSGIIVCALLFFMSCAVSLTAQVNTDFQITKITPSMPLTPAVSFGGTQKNTPPPKRWLEVQVDFTWKPRLATDKYADDVVINYYVLLANKSALTPQGTLLSGQVMHSTIISSSVNQAAGNQPELHSVMYVSPRTLERFFEGKVPATADSAIVDIGVTITRQGQIVAEKILKGSGEWWAQLQQTNGYLLNKDETPFASLYWDYFEAVKSTKQ